MFFGVAGSGCPEYVWRQGEGGCEGVKYVYSLEEALKASAKENKPVFFNCFADWATPCHSMNKVVFSDREFAGWLNDHFVCLYMDMVANNDVAVKYDVKVFAHYLILIPGGR